MVDKGLIQYDTYHRNVCIWLDHLSGDQTAYLAKKYDVSESLVYSILKKHEKAEEFSYKKQKLYDDYISKQYTEDELCTRYSIHSMAIPKYLKEADIVRKYKSGVPIRVIREHYELTQDKFEKVLYKNAVYDYFSKN